MLDDSDRIIFYVDDDIAAQSSGAEPVSYWDSLQSETHFILTDANAQNRDQASKELLVTVGAAFSADPTRPILIAKGWPEVTAEMRAKNDLTFWQVAIASYQADYLALLEAAETAFPQATFQRLDLANVLADLFELSALSDLTVSGLFTEEAPAGGPIVTALAGLIVEMARSAFPIGPGEDLPVEILTAYDAISTAVWDTIGGELADVQNPVLEAETEGDVVNILPASSFLGTSADDTIVFASKFETILGGDGLDTVEMDITAAQSIVRSDEDGGIEVILAGGEDKVTLLDVERIAFEDGTLAFDDDGIAGQAYRLYQACFDRIPDAEGLGFWIKQLDAGNVTLTETAGYFLTSEEFAEVYGKPSELADINYLALLYANVLDRPPDAEGFDFWRAQQENGITRSDMLVYFSESVENVANVAEAIDDGIWYI